MKNKLTLFLVFFTYISFSQNHYKELYDDEVFCSNCLKVYKDTSPVHSFYWAGSELMESLLIMYETTEDIKYINIFIKNAKVALSLREDMKDFGKNMHDLDRKVWSSSYYNDGCINYEKKTITNGDWHKENHEDCQKCFEQPYLVGNANIIYNFVKFYNIVNSSSSLSIHNDYANTLLNKAKETFYFYNNYYKKYTEKGLDCGAYIELYDDELHDELGQVDLLFEKARLPLNMQASIGRVLIELYKASIPGSCEKDEFKNKLIELANHFKVYTNTVTDEKSNRDRKQWGHWGYQDPLPDAHNNSLDPETIDELRKDNPLRDDISHSGLTVMFPYECFINGIKNFENNELLFDQQYIDEYAYTLLDDVLGGVLQDGLNGSLIINDGVHNGSKKPRTVLNYRNPKPDLKATQFDKYSQYTYQRWISFSGYQRDNKKFRPEIIFNALNDLNFSKYYFTKDIGIKQHFSENLQRPIILAYLNKYQQRLAPIAAEHGWFNGVSWVGVASGNFTTDPGDEFVYVRNHEGRELRIEKFTPQTNMYSLKTVSWSEGDDSEYQWTNIGAGNFIEEATSIEQIDEVIAISNNSNKSDKNGCFLFKVEGNLIKEVSSLTGNDISFNWIGVTGGNFDTNKTKDQIVSASNDGLKLDILEVNQNEDIEKLESWSIGNVKGLVDFGLNQNNTSIAAIASGDLDKRHDGDELIVLLNSDEIDISKSEALSGVYVFRISKIRDDYDLEFLYKSTGWGSGSDFNGLSVGDYNGDGFDDFIMHRNSDGFYRMYTFYKKGEFSPFLGLGTEFFPKNQSNNGIIASGDFDVNSKNDEIVVFREDVGIVAYTHTKKVKNNSPPILKYLSEKESLLQKTISNIIIYPNPTTGIVKIESKKKIKNVKLKDINGKKIKSNYSKERATINISNLSTGVYFLTIKLEDNTLESKKIIKN